MIGLSVSAAACADVAMKFVPAAAAAPTSATVPKKSRRAILSLIGNPLLWVLPGAAADGIFAAHASIAFVFAARGLQLTEM
jgi:hypothetical protein